METKTLDSEKREVTNKNEVKKVRHSGRIPAIIYGSQQETVSVTVNESDYYKLLKNESGKNTIISLNISDGKKTTTEQVISYSVDIDPLSRKVTHIDFFRVEKGKPVKVNIPLSFNGVAPGTKVGGTLIKKLDTLTIKSDPANIPLKLDVDLSTLNVGSFLSASDICGDEFELITFSKNIVVRVEAPRKKEDTADDGEVADASAEGEEAEEESGED